MNEEKKSAAEGLRELKRNFFYKKVASTTLDWKGKKIKFRNLVADQARTLTRYNKHNFQKNRMLIIDTFEKGGVQAMFDYYHKELAAGVKNKIDTIKKEQDGKD